VGEPRVFHTEESTDAIFSYEEGKESTDAIIRDERGFFFVTASNCGIPFAFEAATTKARALGAEYCYRAK
jgi:hypothetical protein